MCIKVSVITVVGLNELSVLGRQRMQAPPRTAVPPRLLWHQL